MITMTSARAARPSPRTCPWTLAPQHQMFFDLELLAQSPGWTPLGACGIHVAVRCRSADSRMRAGGDWHLSMPMRGGDLLLAIGDIAGHGLTAAAEMVRLRYAMASLARDHVQGARRDPGRSQHHAVPPGRRHRHRGRGPVLPSDRRAVLGSGRPPPYPRRRRRRRPAASKPGRHDARRRPGRQVRPGHRTPRAR